MARVQVEALKTKVTHVGDEVLVTMPNNTSPALGVFLLPWLVAWVIGAKLALTELFNDLSQGRYRGKEVFLVLWGVAWVVVWLAAGAFLSYLIGWSFAGRESVTITPHVLRLRGAIGRFGMTREYPLSEVQRLRVQPFLVTRKGYTGKKSSLIFDYRGKTIAFAEAMDELETIYVRRLMGEHAPVLEG